MTNNLESKLGGVHILTGTVLTILPIPILSERWPILIEYVQEYGIDGPAIVLGIGTLLPTAVSCLGTLLTIGGCVELYDARDKKREY